MARLERIVRAHVGLVVRIHREPFVKLKGQARREVGLEPRIGRGSAPAEESAGIGFAAVEAVPKADIDADLAQGKTVKADGTPHFFINGRRLVGAQPFDKFKVVIDEELVRAEAMLKTGVPKTGLYEALTKPTP